VPQIEHCEGSTPARRLHFRDFLSAGFFAFGYQDQRLRGGFIFATNRYRGRRRRDGCRDQCLRGGFVLATSCWRTKMYVVTRINACEEASFLRHRQQSAGRIESKGVNACEEALFLRLRSREEVERGAAKINACEEASFLRYAVLSGGTLTQFGSMSARRLHFFDMSRCRPPDAWTPLDQRLRRGLISSTTRRASGYENRLRRSLDSSRFDKRCAAIVRYDSRRPCIEWLI
jgi:hypothetical protein